MHKLLTSKMCALFTLQLSCTVHLCKAHTCVRTYAYVNFNTHICNMPLLSKQDTNNTIANHTCIVVHLSDTYVPGVLL